MSRVASLLEQQESGGFFNQHNAASSTLHASLVPCHGALGAPPFRPFLSPLCKNPHRHQASGIDGQPRHLLMRPTSVMLDPLFGFRLRLYGRVYLEMNCTKKFFQAFSPALTILLTYSSTPCSSTPDPLNCPLSASR